MDLFQILAADYCTAQVKVLVAAVKSVINFIGWIVPAALIILGTIDIFKAMTNGDEKEQKKAQQTFIKRLVYALVIFLIPFIIQLVFSLAANLLGDEGDKANNSVLQFFNCYTEAKVTRGQCKNANGDTKNVPQSECGGDGFYWSEN